MSEVIEDRKQSLVSGSFSVLATGRKWLRSVRMVRDPAPRSDLATESRHVSNEGRGRHPFKQAKVDWGAFHRFKI